MKLNLTPSQIKAKSAFENFLKSNQTCICLSGKPGTGKTFFIKEVLVPMVNTNPYITATTNKAALLLKGNTIFNALGVRVTQSSDVSQYRIDASKAKTIRNSLIIIDEASMLDKSMLDVILNKCIKCKIIFVGDKNQLPAIKHPANVFDKYPVVELTDVVRQKKADLIQAIEETKDNISKVVLELPKASQNVHVIRSEDELKAVLGTFTPEDRILSYTNDACYTYASMFRELLNMPKIIQPGDRVFSKSYCESPNANRSTLFASEEALVTSISEPHNVNIRGQLYKFLVRDVCLANKSSPFILPEDMKLYKTYLNGLLQKALKLKELGNDPRELSKTWGLYYFFRENMVDLRDFVACTVHESQGSTYNRVIIDFDDIVHGQGITINTKTRMLYVAMSRAKEEVFIYTRRH